MPTYEENAIIRGKFIFPLPIVENEGQLKLICDFSVVFNRTERNQEQFLRGFSIAPEEELTYYTQMNSSFREFSAEKLEIARSNTIEINYIAGMFNATALHRLFKDLEKKLSDDIVNFNSNCKIDLPNGDRRNSGVGKSISESIHNHSNTFMNINIYQVAWVYNCKFFVLHWDIVFEQDGRRMILDDYRNLQNHISNEKYLVLTQCIEDLGFLLNSGTNSRPFLGKKIQPICIIEKDYSILTPQTVIHN